MRRSSPFGFALLSPSSVSPPTPTNWRSPATSSVWALPRSLATTEGISVDFFCSSYCDVSVRLLPSSEPMHSAPGVWTSLQTGCPIRILTAHRLHAAPRERFAGLRVLLRPDAPRHPPWTRARLCLLGWGQSAPLSLQHPDLGTRHALASVSLLSYSDLLLVCSSHSQLMGVPSAKSK